MIPDIDLRLQNALKALSEVVLPALPAAEGLAREQAQLAIAHLAIVKQQWKYALEFELGSHDALCALARRLRPQVADAEMALQIDAAQCAAVTLDRSDYDIVSTAHRALAALVARAIDDGHTSAPMDRELLLAVLEHGERQSLRERAWFAGCGIDPDHDQLPPFTTLLG